MRAKKQGGLKGIGLPVYAVGFFLVGVASGAVFYPQVADALPMIVETIFEGILVPSSKFKTTLNIIARNSTATLVLILSGLTVAVPFFIVYVNGFFTGLALRFIVTEGVGFSTVLWGLIPHGVFELTAFFWSAGLAFGVGIKVIDGVRKHRSKQVIVFLKKSLVTYVKFILPLLVVAGFVETYVSAEIIGAALP